MPVLDSSTYTYSWWAKSGDATGGTFDPANTQSFGFRPYDSNGLALSGARFTANAAGITVGNEWTRYEVEIGAGTDATFPVGTATIRPIAKLNDGLTSGNQINWRDVGLTHASEMFSTGDPLVLHASIADLEPLPGESVEYTWHLISGPGLWPGNEMSGRNVTVIAPDQLDDYSMTFEVIAQTDTQAVSSLVTTYVESSGASAVLASASTSAAAAEELVSLEASASALSNVTYAWHQISGPLVTINNADARIATFAAPSRLNSSDVGFKVVASDGFVSVVDTVYVSVDGTGTEPFSIETEVTGTTVELTAGEVDSAVYTWQQISGPPVTLSSGSGRTISFQKPSTLTAQSAVFEVVADDGQQTLTNSIVVAIDPVVEALDYSVTMSSKIGGLGIPGLLEYSTTNTTTRYGDEYFPVSAESRYTMSVAARSGKDDGSEYFSGNQQSLGFIAYDAAENAIGSVAYPLSGISIPDVWQDLTFDVGQGTPYLLPEGTASVRFFASLNQHGSGANRIRLKDLSLDDAATTSYKEGTQVALRVDDVDIAGVSYSWHQLSGPAVQPIADQDGVLIFDAPEVTQRTQLDFVVTATVGDEVRTRYATVDILPVHVDVYQAALEIRNTILFEPSHGLIKGPDAVLATQRGNAWDIANLLSDRIGSSAQTRIVTGRVSIELNALNSWLGTESDAAAVQILDLAGLNPVTVNGAVQLDHAWLEVEVDSDSWVTFDAAWKQTAWSTGDLSWDSAVDLQDYLEPTVHNYSNDFESHSHGYALSSHLIAEEGVPSIWWHESDANEQRTTGNALVATHNEARVIYPEKHAVEGTIRMNVDIRDNGQTFYVFVRSNADAEYGFRMNSDGTFKLYKRLESGDFEPISGVPVIAWPGRGNYRVEVSVDGDVLEASLYGYSETTSTMVDQTISATIESAVTSSGYFGFVAQKNLGDEGQHVADPDYDVWIDDIEFENLKAPQLRTGIDAILDSGSLTAAEVPSAPRQILNSNLYQPADAGIYQVISQTGTHSTLPDSEKHRVEIILTVDGQQEYSGTFPVHDISRKTVLLDVATNGNVQLFTDFGGSDAVYDDTHNNDEITITVNHFDAGSTTADRSYTFDVPDTSNSGTGGYSVLTLHADQFAPSDLVQQQTLLSHKVLDLPDNPGWSQAEEASQITLGVMSAQYAMDSARVLEEVSRTTNARSVRPYVTSGIVTSGYEISVEADNVYFVVPDNIRIDQPSPGWVPVPVNGQNMLTTDPEQQARTQTAMLSLSQLENRVISSVTNKQAASATFALALNAAADDPIYRLQDDGSGNIVNLFDSTIVPDVKALLEHSDDVETDIETFLDRAGNPIITVSKSESAVGWWQGSAYLYEEYVVGNPPVFQSYLSDDLATIHGGIASGSEPLETPVDSGSQLASPFSGTNRRFDTDTRIPSVGIPITIERTWTSPGTDQSQFESFGMGVGWNHTYGEYMSLTFSHAIWHAADGSAYPFFRTIDPDVGDIFEWIAPDTMPRASLTYDRVAKTVTLILEDGTTREFQTQSSVQFGNSGADAKAYLSSIEDRYGNEVNVERKSTDVRIIERVTHRAELDWASPPTEILTYEYSGQYVSKITDQLGNREWNYNYVTINGHKYLQSVDGPAGVRTHVYSYFGDDPDDFEFPAADGSTGTLASLAGTQAQYYAANNNPTELRGQLRAANAFGGVTETYAYYRNGRFFTAEKPDGESLTYTYDLYRHATQVMNPEGGMSELRYSRDGLLIEQVEADGSRTVNEYDGRNRMVASSSTGKGRTQYTYDDFGNIVTQIDPTGLSVIYQYEYEADGSAKFFHQPKQITTDPDPAVAGDERVVEFEYDADGNTTRSEDAEDQVWQFSFNPNGQMTSDINPRGYARTFAYDDRGMMTETVYFDGASSVKATATYDVIGRITSFTDETAITTSYTYDDYGRVLQKSLADPYAYGVDSSEELPGQNVFSAIARYTFDNDPNEGFVRDATGKGYDLWTNGLTSASYGPSATYRSDDTHSLNFDAADAMASTSGLPSTPVETVAFWLNPNQTYTASSSPVIVAEMDSQYRSMGSGTAVVLGNISNGLTDEVVSLYNYELGEATAIPAAALAAVPVGEWTHFAFVWNDATDQYDAWVNGVLIGNTIDTFFGDAPKFTSENLVLGQRDYLGSELPYSGAIDDFGLYPIGLEADDIAFLAGRKRGIGNGTIAEYRFDESSVTTANDSSGNGNDLTLIGFEAEDRIDSATWQSGDSSALRFDSWSAAASATGLPSTDVASLAFWINPNLDYTSSTSPTVVAEFDDSTGVATGAFVGLGNWTSSVSDEVITLMQYGVGVTAIPASAFENNTVAAGEWTHVAFVWNGSQFDAYVNGTAVTTLHSSGGAGQFSSENLLIGQRDYPGSPMSYNGAIDHLALYANSLNEHDLEELTQQKHSALISAWSFDSDTNGSTNVTNESVNTATLALSGIEQTDWRTPATFAEDDTFALSFESSSAYGQATNVSGEMVESIAFWLNPAGDLTAASPVSVVAELDSTMVALGNITGSLTGELITLLTPNGVATAIPAALLDGQIDGGMWTHVAFIYNATTQQYDGFVNGSSVTTIRNSATEQSVTASTVTLGKRDLAASPLSFAGSLDDFRLYSESLPVEELKNLASPDVAASLGLLTTTYHYGPDGRIASQTNADGQMTRFTYTINGQIDRQYNNDGTYHSFQYNGRGDVISTIDELGRESRHVFDVMGRETQTIAPDGGRQTMVYDTAGNMVKQINGLGATMLYTYDIAGRLTGEEDALGATAAHAYDSYGNRTQTVDARGNITVWEYDGADRLTRTIYGYQAAGGDLYTGIRIDDNAYDTNGNLTSTHSFDISGLASATVAGDLFTLDASRQQHTYMTYDYENRLLSTTDAAGQTAYREYDDAGRLTRETDVRGATTIHTFDQGGLQLQSFGPAATPTGERPSVTYARDEVGHVVATTDANRNTTLTVYDDRGRAVAVTDALGHTTTSEYNAASQVIATTNALGHSTITLYDAAGRAAGAVTAVSDSFGNADLSISRQVYDVVGNVIESIDPLGRSVVNFYDYMNRLVRTVQPDPDVSNPDLFDTNAYPGTTYTYDAAGNLETETSVLGAVTQYEYDALNRPTRVTIPHPDGTTQTETHTDSVYDGFGNQVSVIVNADTSDERETTMEYDALNRPIRETGPYVYDILTSQWAQPVTQWTYDAAGNMLTVTDALGRITSSEYDDAGMVIKVTSEDPDPSDGQDQSVSFAYDLLGNRISQTDALGHTTRTTYDELNRPVAIIQPDTGDGFGNPITRTYYDAAGRTVAVIDPLGRTIVTEFDALSRPIRRIEPDPDFDFAGGLNAPETVWTYDLLGNVLEMTDGTGITTTSEYDYLNRLITQTLSDPDGTGPLSSPMTVRTYDLAGNVLTEDTTFAGAVGNSGRLTSFEYDILGRLEKTIQPDPDGVSGPLPAPVTETVYDAVGNVDWVVDHLNRKTVFSYDRLNRIVAEQNPDPTPGSTGQDEAMTTWYDLVGNVVETRAYASDALGTVTHIDYDVLNRPVSTTVSGTNASLSITTSVSYDANGNVITETDPMGRVTEHAYDALNRSVLTRTPDPDGPGSLRAHETRTFYDAVGNILAVTDHLGRQTRSEYDRLNRVIQITSPDPDPSDSMAAPASSTVYDQQGNILMSVDALGRETTFAYDALNRPIQTTLPVTALGQQPVTQTQYDNFGNVYAEVDALGHQTRFVYDALNRVTSTWLIEEDGSPSGITHPGTLTAYNDAGNVVSITVQMGGVDPDQVTSFTYDRHDRQLSTIHADLSTTDTTYDAVGNVASETDGLGNATTYGYDILGRLTSTTWEDAGSGAPVESTAYDAAGNVIRTTDVLGRTTTNVYDDLNRLIYTILPHAEFEELTDDNGNPQPIGPILTKTYDQAGQLAKETDVFARYTTYEYDDLDRLVLTVFPDPDGPSIGSPAYNTLPSATLTNTYDLVGNIVQTEDHLGRITVFHFDALDRLVREDQPDPDQTAADANNFNEYSTYMTYKFDAAGRQTEVTLNSFGSGTGRTTWFTYDAFGRVLTESQPNLTTDLQPGDSTTYEYDAAGNRTKVIDALGRETEFKYDVMNREVESIAPDPDDFGPGNNGPLTAKRMTTHYNAAGNVDYQRDYQTTTTYVQTSYGYDALNRQTSVSVTLPGGDVSQPYSKTSTEYDLAGNQIATIDALDHRTEYVYDRHNRLIETHFPNVIDGLTSTGPVTKSVYDDAGNVIISIDPLGRERHSEFDRLNRPVSVSGPLEGMLVETSYNEAGLKEVVVEQQSENSVSITSYYYDRLDRQIVAKDNNDSWFTYRYDVFGNTYQIEDGVGNITQYAYDRLNRVTSETINPTIMDDVRSFVYDAVGNTDHTIDRRGLRTDYTYDNLNRLLAEVWKNGSGANDPIAETISWTYDNATGLVKSTSDSQHTYTYEYDALGRLTDFSTVGTAGLAGTTFAYEWDVNSNLKKRTQTTGGSDLITQWTYDGLDRLRTIGQSGPGFTNKSIIIAYNDDNTRDTESRYEGSVLKLQTHYDYDGAGRPIEIHHQDAIGTTLNKHDLEFDLASRVTQHSNTIDGDSDYTYDGTDQLLTATHAVQTDESYDYDLNGNRIGTGIVNGEANRVMSDGVYDYEYDAEGNRSKRTQIAGGEITEYEWDHRNRLVAVKIRPSAGATPTTIVTYSYDEMGNRIRRQEDTDHDGVIDIDQAFLHDDRQEVAELNATGQVEHLYVDGVNADEIFANENAVGDILWPLTDHKGTVMDVAGETSGSIQVLDHRVQDSFGNMISQTNAAVDHAFSFTGRAFDAVPGLYNIRARWLDPVTGNWISEDPLSFAAGDSNLTRYSNNDPINKVDPSGLGFFDFFSDIFDDVGDFFEDIFDDVGNFFEDVGHWIGEQWDNGNIQKVLLGAATVATAGAFAPVAAGGFTALASIHGISTTLAFASAGVNAYEVFTGDQIGDGTFSRILNGASVITGGIYTGLKSAGKWTVGNALQTADALVSGYEIATGDTIGDGSLSGILHVSSLGVNQGSAVFDPKVPALTRARVGLNIASGAASLVNTGDRKLQRALRSISIASSIVSAGTYMQSATTAITEFLAPRPARNLQTRTHSNAATPKTTAIYAPNSGVLASDVDDMFTGEFDQSEKTSWLASFTEGYFNGEVEFREVAIVGAMIAFPTGAQIASAMLHGATQIGLNGYVSHAQPEKGIGLQWVSDKQMTELFESGLAHKTTSGTQTYSVVHTVHGRQVQSYIYNLRTNPGAGGVTEWGFANRFPGSSVRSEEELISILNNINTKEHSDRLARWTNELARNEGKLSAIQFSITAMSALPVVGSAEALDRVLSKDAGLNDYVDFGLSVAGDSTLVAGWASKFGLLRKLKGTKAAAGATKLANSYLNSTIHTRLAAFEGAVAIANVGQAAYATMLNEKGEAAGYIGEAIIRTLGAKSIRVKSGQLKSLGKFDQFDHYRFESPSGQEWELLLDSQQSGKRMVIQEAHFTPVSGAFENAQNLLGKDGLDELARTISRKFRVNEIEIPNKVNRVRTGKEQRKHIPFGNMRLKVSWGGKVKKERLSRKKK